MRRVDAEGDSRGVRGQQQADTRSRSKLRRAAIEWLERRELLSTSTSTLPSPTVISPPSLTPNQQVQDVSLAAAVQALTPAATTSSDTPSVAVDPLNPLRMAAVWVDQDATQPYDPGNGFNVPITSYLEGAYSTNGGKTWTAMTPSAFGQNGNEFTGAAGGMYSVNVQEDASLAPSTSVTNVLPETTDPTIGYDRSGNFYILSSTHTVSNATGVLDLQRFSWGESAGAPTYLGITQVDSWDTADSGTSVDEALTPVLAVDSNLPSFTDPSTGTTVTDPYSGNVYAVWTEFGSNTYDAGIPTFDPYTIRMAASSNQGVSFTHDSYVDNPANVNNYNSGVATNPPSSSPLHDAYDRDSEPSVTISQGGGSTPAGQVTVVYDDHNISLPVDLILDQNSQDGGTSDQFGFTYTPPSMSNPSPTGTIPSGTGAVPGTVSVPITVSLPSTFTLQDLDITLKVQFPNMSYYGATLVPPSGSGLASIPLFFSGRIGDTPGADNTTGDLGYTAESSGLNDSGAAAVVNAGTLSGTVFDPEAIRSISDGTSQSHVVGHYQPAGESALTALKGKTGTLLSGTWTLQLTTTTADTSTTDIDFIDNVNLNFSQGNDPGGDGTGSSIIAGQNSLYEVPIPNINPTDTASSYGVVYHTDNTSSTHYDGVDGTNVSGGGVLGIGTSYTTTTQIAPILPDPVITSDDTLGSFSPYSGRMYVAFTGAFTGAQAGDTDIFLAYSTDGGHTWSTLQQVNDDNAATDGFSGASDDAVGNDGITGRAQYDPQVAVDNTTGDVVVSFLDARNDPSNARVATYVAVSADGATVTAAGNSGFAADVYANPSQTATNAIDSPGSNTVNLGPIPDNESSTGGVASTDGYGTRQALVVTNGRIVPFWASNENMAVQTAIVDSVMSLTAGPRVIASTQGPVGNTSTSTDSINVTKDASGTTLANTIDITFDRTIDPTSYAAGVTSPMGQDISIYYESPAGGAKVLLPVTAVTPLNANVATGLGATMFAITFNPAALAGTTYGYVGTYSYAIAATGIVDQIRQAVGGARGTVMDQNADGTPGEVTGDDYVVGQPAGFAAYATGTLPLIVPGPHVLSVTPISPTTNASIVNAGSTDDLVLNNTVSALEVTFDRNILVSSFTAAQILSIFGPAGAVSLTGLTITPLTVYSAGGQVTYTNGAAADVFKITFGTQQISGTYAITLGTGITAADTAAGTTQAGVDANLNAGLDELRQTATNGETQPFSYPSTMVPATIAPATVNTDGSVTPSVLMAPIVVPDDFPIQGDDTATGVSGITLSLSILYPTDPDLVAYLLAPDGVTKINLFTNVGAGTNTANFSPTTFSDTASTSVDKATAPFFGTFLPEQPFADLGPGTGNANLDTQGTWTLVIENSGGSSGTLASWSLTFQKPISSTGLAEFPDDESQSSFQIFDLAATNPLANSTWTAIGPAGVTTTATGKGTLAGTVSSVAVDPSDTTGNTVFVGTAGGGIWKTTDFLTTAVGGPTYVPLTDNGPSFAQNIGAVAVFGQNNDPSRTIVFGGTGFAQEGTISTSGTPNVELNTGTGDGIIRSMDGGQTWTVLGGVTGSVYKIVVDPTPTLSGQAIVYAATTTGFWRSLDSGDDWTLLEAGNATDIILDPNSGSPTTHNLDTLYVAFSNVTSFDTPYYANGPIGIYYSVNQGQTLQPLSGELGRDPLLVTPGFPATPLPVNNPVTPNNANSAYIVLAKPTLTGNVAENLAYEGWLYAAVENYNGTFQGLYVTKDAGENWTLVQLPNIPGTGSDKAAVPTNATTATDSYDPTSSNFTDQGGYDLTITVDPSDPNIVYLGGSQNFQGSGLIRVDLTDLYDAHNLTSGSNDRSGGGTTTVNGQGGVTTPQLASNGLPAIYESPTGGESNILNLRYAPNNGTAGTSPFNINATLVVAYAGAFINDGTGATWSLFDEPLKANAGDETGSTNLHDVIDYVDPITGDVRMIFADDEGVFATLVNQDGTMDAGIGTDAEPEYSRNGNLQDEELLDSAAQPSAAAAASAGAEVYASGTNTLAAQSDASVLTDGNLTWSDSGVLTPSPSSPRSTSANSSINSSDRSGVGIATDQTGSGTLFEYDVPILGGNLTDFFRVNQFGQTTGLDNDLAQEFPDDNYNGDAHEGGVAVTPVTNTGSPNLSPSPVTQALTDGQIPTGNFEVNPLNGDQILIASATGNLYETTNQGILWVPIGNADDFGADANVIDAIDGGKFTGDPGRESPLPIQLSAIAYGAPDPNVIGGVGNLNNFIYVGTTGSNYDDPDLENRDANPPDLYLDSDGLSYNDAHIYVTQAGGQGWLDISKGLDGSSIVGIYPDPDRGSHAAYAVTKTGIFYSPDTIGLADAGSTVWTNITSNLESLTFDAFGNPAYQQSVLAGFSYSPANDTYGTTSNLLPPLPYNPVFNSQYGGFTDIVADYRYEIPAPTNATEGTNIFYPVLYASGFGGVFRSVDNGATWTVFPNEAFDNAPVDGGYLPDVDVTSLSLVLGDINPDTGHPQATTHSATSTAPPITLNPTGTVMSTLTLVDTSGVQISAGTVVVTLNDTSASGGNNVGDLTITLTGPGGQTFILPTSSLVATSLNSATFQLPATFLASQDLVGTYTLSVADNKAGDVGKLTAFGISLIDVNPELLLASTYGRGDFAIRLSPDVIPTSVAFDTSLPAPNGSDSSGVGITNTLDPYFDGVSEVSNYGNTVTVNIYDESPGSAFFGALLGTGTTNALGQFVIQINPSTAVLNGQTVVDTYFLTSSTAYNDKTIGIQATDSADASGNMTLFHYTLDTINPNTPNAPVLEATYDTGRSTIDGLTNLSVPPQAGPGGTLNIVTPVFDVTTPLPQANPLSPNPISLTVELLRSTSANGPFSVIDMTETGFVNTAGTLETYMLNDPGLATLAAAGIDETFYYEALQIDEAGNVSTPGSNVTAVTVDTIAPAAPTGLTLVPPITGTPPSPTFSVAGVLPNDQVLLYRSINGGTPILVGTGAVNTTNAAESLPVTDTVGASPDGVYTYYAAQLDVYGNFSLLSAGVMEIINTQAPPAAPVLQSTYDTGRSNSDDITDIAVPAPTPGSTPNFVAPIFNVTTVAPASGQPAIATVQLFRATSAAGPYTMVASVPFNGNPAMLTDTSLVALVSGGVNEAFYYEADQINAAGIESSKSPALKVTLDTVTPGTLPAPTLDPASNSGLVPGQLITNVTKPFIDYTNLAPGDQAFLYRSIGSAAPILVGTGPINTTGSNLSGKIQDIVGATPDGVYQYFVVQQDIAGNISKYSQAVTVTINTTTPPRPTIALLTSDDTGLPSHPNVTNVNTPHFTGTSPYNSGTNFPVAIINVATGAVLAMTFPAANGTYLAQITTPLPDGVYTLEARTTNLAGTNNYSLPLTITIKHTGPMVPPNLMLLPADDTGIKGDGVTSDHDPAFIGTTDPGDIVSLYVLVNGTLLGPEATTTSSTINGSFTFTLPFNLTDGTTELVAQTSDIAGNKGVLSNPYTVRITTTTGDYLGTGSAQLAIFDPYSETYYIRVSATQTVTVPVDTTVGRDVPIQYDFNGDGVTDLSAFRYNTAQFYGFISNGAIENQQFGPAGASLPVSGYYGGSGTYIPGAYVPSTGTWYVALPTPGGVVLRFGVPDIDIPVPAAYNGGGATEIAVFRPTTVTGGDADAFFVVGPNGQYEVSFTNPAVAALGFVYKAGDVAAPGDYLGLGYDQFAVYRASTGQFFILNTPSDTNTKTWTLKTVTLNLPGGPKAGDVPVSEDYYGNGLIDPAVYRPSNSTFYILNTATGQQSTIQFQPFVSTLANQFIAAAGPILYRLNALLGTYASTGGYLPTAGGGGGTANSIVPLPGGSSVHAESVTASAATSTAAAPADSAASPLTTLMAVAMPIAVTTTPTASAPTTSLALSSTPSIPVTVGVKTPTASAAIVAPKATSSHLTSSKKVTKHAAETSSPEVSTKPSTAKSKAHATPTPAETHAKATAKVASTKAESKSRTTLGALAAASLQHLVMAAKGRKKS